MQKIQKEIHIYNTEQDDSRVKPISVWCSALFDSSNNTPVRLCISSFLNLSHLVTPHILLKHLFSMTSRRFCLLFSFPRLLMRTTLLAQSHFRTALSCLSSLVPHSSNFVYPPLALPASPTLNLTSSSISPFLDTCDLR